MRVALVLLLNSWLAGEGEIFFLIVTWLIKEKGGNNNNYNQSKLEASYSICCSDGQVKLVQSFIPVQCCAGADLPRLLVYGQVGWWCASCARTYSVG